MEVPSERSASACGLSVKKSRIRSCVRSGIDQHDRRPDIVLFINGLPLVVIELKNPTDGKATMWTAFNQIQTYKQQISPLFIYNEALVISDGPEARIGSLTADTE